MAFFDDLLPSVTDGTSLSQRQPFASFSMKILETERMILREFESSDIDVMADLLADGEVMRFSHGLKCRNETQAWLEVCRKSYSDFGFGLWAIEKRGVAGVIGYCGLSRFPDICGQEEIEVGYRLSRSEWGFGFATEAALAVRDHGFKAAGVDRLVALVDPGNVASIQVSKKIGMKFEREVFLEGYDHPDQLYCIKNPHARRPEWLSRKTG